jgi:glycine/D-amino acid oxidase-like deaminating enzyme
MSGAADEASMRALSMWHDTHPGPFTPRPALAGDLEVDVAIVGGGYSGLWTAYYLRLLDPTLRVVVIEREVVGFGASGRNGGWCIGEVAASPDVVQRASSNDMARRFLHEVHGSVDEVGRVAAAEGIDCHFAKGGTLRLARNPAHLSRQRAEVEHHQHEFGLTDDDLRMLGASEAAARVGATSVLGAMFFAHTAALHPTLLVRGLGEAVERHGGVIVEGTAALAIESGQVQTTHGTVRAEVIVRATEGYTRDLEGHGRTLVPLYSLMIATEPIDDATWESIGLAERETFSDDRHLVIYGQRTADGRIAFGGRGAPYGFGSRIDSSIEQQSATHDLVESTLRDLFPQLADVGISHRWGGVLGVPRDWFPSVGLDRSTGLGWAGGYVGEGVAAANLAGRTLAELISGVESPRTDLPWVDHRSRRWEPEPLRWLAINGALRAMTLADRAEARSGKDSLIARTLWKLLR